ncbi:hypothetical protein ACIG87_18730 [Micromonospora sp. NPDC051925]|uniref:hypothetical protein n=1 Tax=Micromonospora sp. NPDC051925 TaxID=3364288 RepID=UPI0037C5FFDE
MTRLIPFAIDICAMALVVAAMLLGDHRRMLRRDRRDPTPSTGTPVPAGAPR